ncbi:hypothetical protein CPAV1605_550 [seawater metagenome]|uniref:Uncharacterized protein n=1 Tax=seawater metagenome TaxID=1561972 RepID=A0A5E8CLF8_9ZZZZ
MNTEIAKYIIDKFSESIDESKITFELTDDKLKVEDIQQTIAFTDRSYREVIKLDILDLINIW